MNRVIQFVIACCFSLVAFGAQPGFGSFNTNQFDITGNRVALKDGLIVTNLTLTGAGVGNLFEVYNQSDELKFWVDTNGFSYPQIWTNSAGTIQASSTLENVSSSYAFSLNAENNYAIEVTARNNKSFNFSNGYLTVTGSGFDVGSPTDASYFSYYENAILEFYVDNRRLFAATPFNGGAGDVPYLMDTVTNRTGGNLLEVKNNGTNKFVVPWDGAVQIPGDATANSLTITNELTAAGSSAFNTFTANSGTVTNGLTVQGALTGNTFTANSGTVSNSLTLQGGANITSGNLTNSGTYVGTIDGAATGTTLKQVKSLKLQFPRLVDGAGCTYANTNDYTAMTFMLPQFSGTAATNVNFCQFAFRVPKDLDTSVDLTGSLTIRLTGADTAAHSYTVGMVSIANSSTAAGTAANYVTLTVGADGSGASGDIENVNDVTLTGWRSAMTAGQWCLVQLQRDGSDSSTVASNLMELEIFYTSTQ